MGMSEHRTTSGYASSPGRSTVSTVVVGLVITLIGGYIVAITNHWLPPIPSPFATDVSDLVGGCERFAVFSQNRYPPAGAKSRDAPFREANDVQSFAPNELIAVDGYVRTRAAYPSNPAPFNSDVWFHVADGSGWVSYAAVRADPTTMDPTGMSDDGGRPVPLDPECSGSYRN